MEHATVGMSGSIQESKAFSQGENHNNSSNNKRKLSKSLLDLYQESQAQNMKLTAAVGRFPGSGGGKVKDKDIDNASSAQNNNNNNNKNTHENITKVSISKLLSFATFSERCWMVFGLGMATLAGLGIPVWLALLARALDSLSQLGVLIAALPEEGSEGLEDILKKEMAKLAVAFIIVGAITFVTGSLYVAVWTYTGKRQSMRIRKAFVKSALNQDAAWFDQNNREALPTQMGTSLVYISSSIGRNVADTYGLGVSAIGCLAVAFWLNSALSFIMLGVIPVVAIVMLIFNYFIRKANQRANEDLAVAGSIATEVVAGIKTVAALCAKRHFAQAYTNRIDSSEQSAIRGGELQNVLAGIVGVMFYVTYTIAFTIGTNQVIAGSKISLIIRCLFSSDQDCRMTGASVMCCIYAVIISITFIGLMVPGLTAINLGRQAGVHVFETINRKPPIDPSNTSTSGGRILDDDKLLGRIDFSNIFFAYPTHPEKPICYNFSLTVQAGKSIALVGPSGSGKSTIARFLLRFYDPLQGSVSIDGVPLKELNVAWWRSKVGYVEQEPRLFPGTLRDNIAFGKCNTNDGSSKVSKEDIIEAAKAACAHDFIMELPDGYDTYFGGTGVQLSGGQMQRIAIARAIIRKPILLVLDEATSALDSTSERHVTEALANVRKLQKMTTVTIAHRLSTIIDSDLIAVLDEGRVKEVGNHKTLYNKDGIYTLLCTTQGIGADFTSTDHIDEDTKSLTTVASKGDLEMGVKHAKDQEVNMDFAGVDKVEVDMTPMSTIYKYLGIRDGFYALMGFVGSLIVGALSPCEAILTANIVNNFYSVRRSELIEVNREWIFMFYYFAAAALLGNVLVGIGLSRSGNRLGNKLRKLAFAGMLKRSMGWFDDPDHTTGELTTILGADAEVSMSLTGWQMGYRTRVYSALIAGITVAMVYCWQIGITAIACMPLIMLPSLVQACAQRRKFTIHSDGLTPPTILEQGLRGIVSVQAYNLETKVSDDYDKALEPESVGQFSNSCFAGLVYGFTQGVIFITFGIIFFVGTNLLIRAEIDFLQFFAALLAVMFGAIGSSQVSADFSARQEGRAAVARILAVMEGPEDEPESTKDASSKSTAISDLKGTLEFKQCQFGYPMRPDNLIFYPSPSNGNKALNLSASPKTSLGLVGRSGSGKSTVLQLVLRFYDLTTGSCKLDESHSISELDIDWLRHQIGYVGQQPTLFSGTVKDNVLLGKPDASQKEIIAAAKAAHAHDFISQLSEGYDTDIGTGGGQLSGGQKQRIAIARAIIRNPHILVLDEATAALDNESEEKVQAALDSLQETQPRTTLVVAHRLLTVKRCDKIAYLGNGGVIEIGSHDELLEKAGEYSKLWKMQGAEEDLKKER